MSLLVVEQETSSKNKDVTAANLTNFISGGFSIL